LCEPLQSVVKHHLQGASRNASSQRENICFSTSFSELQSKSLTCNHINVVIVVIPFEMAKRLPTKKVLASKYEN